MSIKRFESVSYIDCLFDDPGLAVVPVVMVAEYFGHTRASIDRMIKMGKLEAISVGGTKYVLLTSLKSKVHEYECKIRKVEEIVVDAATQQKVVFQEEIMPVISLSIASLSDYRVMAQILRKVAERHSGSNVLITSIVHKKMQHEETFPGKAFFEHATGLGFSYKNKADFVRDQMEKTYQNFARIYD